MTPEKDIEDELLGRWLAGELSEKERAEFEASEAFHTYQAIADYSSQLEVSHYDVDTAYASVKSKLGKAPQARIIGMPRSRFLAIAASFLVLIGIGSLWFFGNSTVEDTAVVAVHGERKNVTLPDNSTIALNSKTSIFYNEGTWDEKRDVEMVGEAFFSVKKGKPFRVITDHGTVEVLGTKFNVLERGERMEVTCYTGKVRVTDSKNNKVILTKGMAARLLNGELVDDWSPEVSDKPSWQKGFSEFKNVPLEDVIDELEAQYDVAVYVNKNISDRVYHGFFPHDNIDQALELVFKPMNLNYKKENDQVIVVE